MWEYRARIDRVVDGDTLYVIVDLGFRVTCHQALRLLYVDTPERGQPDFKLATETTADWVTEARLYAQLQNNDWPLRVRTAKSEKYGRWLAEVFDLQGRSLNTMLALAGWPASEQ